MKRGVIVLALFPFTDLSDVKKRPALVVSESGRSDGEAILAFIGTYRGQRLAASDCLLPNSHPDFQPTGLKETSFVRLGKLTTLDSTLLLGEIGEISSDLMTDVDIRLRQALEL